MQCKVWIGPAGEAQYAFNKWAKGKALSRDVIIHTHISEVVTIGSMSLTLTIVVFHPDHAPWCEEPQSKVEAIATM